MKSLPCPSCRGPAAHVLPVRALRQSDIRQGFEVAKALKAPVQTSEFLRCARCGMQFDKDTRIGGVK